MATPKRIDASLHIGERLPLEAAANTSNLTTRSKRRHSVHQFRLVGGSEQQAAVRPLINFLKQDSNQTLELAASARLIESDTPSNAKVTSCGDSNSCQHWQHHCLFWQ